MSLEVNDVVEAVSELIKRGYDREYRIKDGGLYDLGTGMMVRTSEIHVDASLRFENGSSRDDGSNVYAITDGETKGKGLLIDAFDTLDQDCSRELFARLTTSRHPKRVSEQEAPSRYGLRKIYKSEFDEDAERYVLRVDFPDFPPCPFGQSFSMLGFDTAEQRYVWLVTSILRDSRLARVPYQAADVPDNE
ncbi:hypothetical protein [Rhizobium mayense]|uniref:Uncharacterized protein n=1 Tax=Rhizobium mayense TaxID=1312184 RepID=A0ABT7K7E5_9HYPH|nr:hypothetical protein [Rhizobium mayense]MDL2403923.1 hypothetical protein [Rhizobium mayense]